MVVCKYFLQGICRFGTACYNDHQIPGNQNHQQHTSILRQATFGSQQPQQSFGAQQTFAAQTTQQTFGAQQTKSPTNVDLSTLTKAVIADMTSAEKGGQWLLSSYAPFKEKSAFPGFEDHSFEEIRLGFYEASKNGTLDQYKQQLQALYQEALQKVQALQNPSQEIVTMLQSIYNSTNTQSTSNIFCTSNTPSNIFGAPNPNTFSGGSLAGQGQNIFSTNQQKSIFASTGGGNIFGASKPAAASNASIFGVSQPVVGQNIFAGNQGAANPSVFSSNQQNATAASSLQTSAFGSQQPAQNNIFANANASPFGTPQQQSNMFVNNQAPTPNQAPNIFASQTSQQNSVFANQAVTPQPQNSMFGANTTPQQQQQPVNNIFGTQPTPTANNTAFAQQPPTFGNQQNIFQAQPGWGNAPNQSTSIFGAPPAGGSPQFAQNQSMNKPVIFGGVQSHSSVDETLYSLEEELTEEEKQWFLSDDLDISRIPEKPPTLRMCVRA